MNVTVIPSSRMPGLKVIRLWKLRTNSSAPDHQHQRNGDLRHHHRALENEPFASRGQAAASARIAVTGSAADARKEGAMPNITHVSVVDRPANSSTRQSIRVASADAASSVESASTRARLR